MTSSYNSRFERRDIVLATITAILGIATLVLGAAGVMLLTGAHF